MVVVLNIKVQPEDTILIGGAFMQVNGVGRDRFASTLSLQEDGKVLVGGSFTNFNGRAYLTRLLGGPKLNLNLQTSGDAAITWPAEYRGFRLQQTSDINGTWENYTLTTTTNDGQVVVPLPLLPNRQFFCLHYTPD